MRHFDLSAGLPPDLASIPALYLLGVGGPEDASGIGHVESFVWRFHALERPDEPLAVLGFTSMALLMALTRAVNAERQGALPTEVLRVAPADIGAPLPVHLWVDLAPADYHELAAGRRGREVRLAGLEGRTPS
jgi:hypothetical protein